MVKIVGVLSWYDESPTWLAQCVASLARCCDHLVAVDGAYALYPQARSRSPLEQQEAVAAAAYTANLPLTLHWQAEPFAGNEIEKRNQTLRLARAVADEDGWLLVVDADMYVLHVSERLKQDLEGCGRMVARYALVDGLDLQENAGMAQAAQTVEMLTQFESAVPYLYRNLPDLEYVQTHYWLRATVDGELRWVAGAPEIHGPDALLPTANLTHALKVAHRNRFRSKLRSRAAHDYYERRDRYGIEPIREVLMEKLDGTVGPVR